MKTVTFPGMNAAQEAKVKRLLDTMAEFMGVTFELDTVVVIQVQCPDDRADFEAIVKRLAKIDPEEVTPKAKALPIPQLK